MAACARLLRPLYDLHGRRGVAVAGLHTDDTPVKIQDPPPGATAPAALWVYLGDRDASLQRLRLHDQPQARRTAKFLADFHGYLHADAFSGYDAPVPAGPARRRAPIIEVACNAHARRKFYEARGSDALRAAPGVGLLPPALRAGARGHERPSTTTQRLRMRQDLAVPILEQFHAWLVGERAEVLPKSPMAEAIGYALNQLDGADPLYRGGLSGDRQQRGRARDEADRHRPQELAVRRLGRGAAKTAAVLFSFTSTCHRLGVEPWAYLQDVLTRLPTPPADLDALLPDHWQAARRAAAVNSDPSS